MKLTQANVARAALPPGRNDVIYFDNDLPGFGLRIQGTKRTWIIQYRIGAKTRRLTLGTVEKVGADKARKEAKNRLARVELGHDPQQEKHDARAAAATAVGKIVEDYLAHRHHEAGGRPLRKSSYEATERYLKKHWKPLHGLQANRLDRSTIASRLREIEAVVSSVTAARARVALSTMFVWAMGEGLIDSNPVIGTNKPDEPKARDRVLTDAELSEIWAACRDDDFGRIVKLLLLTGQRRDEIGDLAWNEIGFDRGVIELAGERTKNKRPHIVPVVSAVAAILEKAPHRARPEGAVDYVFGEGKGGYSGWSKAKASLDRRINDARVKAGVGKPITDWRLHDLRRTAATVMADKLGVLPHVIEAVLNHVSGHKAGVAGVYNRATYLPEKTAALARWADHLEAVVKGEPAKVMPLRAGAP
jgi:integrase